MSDDAQNGQNIQANDHSIAVGKIHVDGSVGRDLIINIAGAGELDERKLQKITQDYLDTIANASEFNYVDEDRLIPLTQVYVMLEAIKTEPPRTREKRDEVSPLEERRQHAGLIGLGDTVPETRLPPVLLSKDNRLRAGS